jgi:hypothetical protein
MEDKKTAKQEQTLEAINVKTSQEKMVPKFCTNINVGLLKTKNVVLINGLQRRQRQCSFN